MRTPEKLLAFAIDPRIGTTVVVALPAPQPIPRRVAVAERPRELQDREG